MNAKIMNNTKTIENILKEEPDDLILRESSNMCKNQFVNTWNIRWAPIDSKKFMVKKLEKVLCIQIYAK